MGGFQSTGQAEWRDTTETFDMLRNSLRKDLATYGACVKAMQAYIDGHVCTIDMFIEYLRDIVNDGRRDRDSMESRMLYKTEEYRKCIKEGLANQSAVLTGTLDHITESLDRIISDDVSRKLASSTSRLSKLEEDNQKLTTDCSRFQKQNITLKKDNDSKQTDINNMNWRLNVLNRELEEQKRKYESERRELQQSLRRKRELEDEVSSLKDSLVLY